MRIFFDSSALCKYFIEEEGTSDDDLNNAAVQTMTVWNPVIETVPQISVLNEDE